MGPDSSPPPEELLAKAGVLAEALPYMRQFNGQRFVIKYGGHAMGDTDLANAFARDVVLLKQVGIEPVIVHGGGPQIGAMLERLKIKSEFVDGLRVTDAETVEIVEMVLSGSINKKIVSAINAAGGDAIGLSGKDGNLMSVRKLRRTRRKTDSNIEKILDLGFVGDPSHVNPELLESLTKADIIPVIAPIGIGEDGATYNVNADTAAGAIASALKAARLLMLTDVTGVLGADSGLIADISVDQARRLIEDGTIRGGMIPKIETCIDAVDNEVGAAVIMDGRAAHSLLIEIFTEHGLGTAVWAD